ncbi:uncharacterized protein LOC114745197 [Neltuma alba]|uniref:uncharacterized protein LOC114745197 n=1 Tax=Neltuma alba TaxID=207710 RepID=UPI0010A561C5|nr:uncharacterized protein LOC114745197 [Prosopis alba]
MEVLTAIAGKIAELTVIPIGRQVGYLLSYKENYKELEDKIEDLRSTKLRIEHLVEAERRNGKEIEVDVVSWQERVDETLKEVEKLGEDQTHTSARCWKWSFPNLISRHQLGRKAKKMAFTIAELKEKGTFDRGVGHVPASGIASLISATPGNEKLDSRLSVQEQVILALTDPKVSKVGIYGWGGVGKTTLAKEVAKHVKDDRLFDVVAMATGSQTLDVERVQDEIAYQLGFHLDEKTSIGRADRLCARIKLEKNILIILDDLWEEIDLDKLGIPSEQDLKGGKFSLTSKRLVMPQKNETYQGCKLLFTSRRLDILQKNETQKNFVVEALNNAESRSLFEDIVGDAIKDANLQKIATQVVERCAGLPVMIVSIAKSLKHNKNIHYWKAALNNLKRVDNGDMYGTVFSAFEFTYNRLEDDEMKKVFLLCGVHGPSMVVRDLLKYVIGLGILKYIDTLEEARSELYKIIDHLKASCLLIEDDASETNVIKMHDLVSEVAVSIARKNEYVFVLRNGRMQDWPSKGFLEECTQIILENYFIQELPQKLECPNLKFFQLQYPDNCTLEIPESFFEGMRSLETLDLTGLVMSSLPTSLVSLTKLKTLCLDDCTLKHMAGIGDLINLEVLSLIKSFIEELPSEVQHLSRLRMLDLSNSIIKTIPPNILSNLTKIEELYVGNASIKWEEESSTKQKSASLAEFGCLTSLTALEIQIRESWMLPRDMMFNKLERYKVVIGDKWEWSSNKRISRLIKLKLDTSIHLEHGIKSLIKRAEDLYLDEVKGISDVLFNLNGEGFPLLKHLHIQNNGQLQHIINTTKRDETHVLFPELETLILHNLNNLVKICHGPLPINSFGKITVIKVQSCDQLTYLFSVAMVKALPQLVELQVLKCSSMERIVSTENEDGGITSDNKIEFHSLCSLSLCHLPVIHDFCSKDLTSFVTATSLFNGIKVTFSSLETLKLSSINLEKIWDDHHLSAANCIHNLANLIVEDCRGLKYLFLSSLIGSLLKLKHLEISKCEMMEEIIAPSGIVSQEVRFTKLETMVVKDMESLKKGTFGSLETLKVSDCGSVEEIFELTAKEVRNEDETTIQVSQLTKLHLFGLPKLKQIWSRDAQANFSFHNLQLVGVEDCENLEYLFPFYIAMQATQLEDITIKYAGRMKRIISDKEGPMYGPVKFEFNHLTSLVLWQLFELEGLFPGKYSILCPLLRELDVFACWKLKLFKTQSTGGQDRVFDSKLQISMQQPLFTFEEVICNLEMLAIRSEDASMILQGKLSEKHFSKLKYLTLTSFEDVNTTFPYWFLQNITTLYLLQVAYSSFKEIFQEEITTDDREKFKIRTRVKALSLSQLHDLQHICKEGFQLDPVLEVLKLLYVGHCSKLKHLVPSSVTFSQLTYLEVENCNGLIHLITSSTARSLVKLSTMKIKNCNSLEQIVAAEEKEGSQDEIAFSNLQILELECLPMIKRFCSSNCVLNLPFLVKVVVKQCPRMRIFSLNNTSTLMLQEILSKEEDEKMYWEGDLNKTIHKMFDDMVAFRGFKHLELYQYPELRESWYNQVQQGVFVNLRNLVVQKCDFLSDVLLPLNLVQALSNLEELQVSESESLEAVFDLTNMDRKEVFVKETIPLKRITLSSLPKLKHIWKQNFQETISFRETTEGHIQRHRPACSIQQVRFPSLQLVCVEDCETMEYLFPLSIAMQTTQLERITIKKAWRMKVIVSGKEGLMDSPIKFEFNHLTSLVLWQLFELEGLFAGKYSILCPLLRELDVRQCGKLKLFKTQSTSGRERVFDHKLQISMQQPLFTLEEVICNLEMLAIHSEDASMILQGKLSEKHFSKLKYLTLTSFEDVNTTFPYWFLQNITTLDLLLVEYSSFKEIFQEEITTDDREKFKIRTRVKALSLSQLHDLQRICKEGFQLDPILEVLEILYVGHCSKLKHLVPSSVTFNQLTYLGVENCNGLIHLVTSSTARSLVKLSTMKIKNCNSLEQIVAAEEREGSEDEIALNSLQILELECLPMIKRFCSSNCVLNLPLLVNVVVKQCPRMRIFSEGDTSTPMLPWILSKEEDEKLYWEGDINRTINKMFVDMVAFHSFEQLELSQYPELRESWYNLVQQGVFVNLRNLVVQKCDFLSDVLLPSSLVQALSNLEELQVSECDSLEAVFDLSNMDRKEVFVKETIPLKRITLSSLPKLKHIWKQNFQDTVSFRETTEGYIQRHRPACSIQQVRFPNLQLVCVEHCRTMEYLFPLSIAMQATRLERIAIKNARRMKHIVSGKEGLMDSPIKFEFNYLTSLVLWNLYELEGFFARNHGVLCPVLRELDVRLCVKLKLFQTQSTSGQERLFDSKLHISMQQSLFTLEEVICNLERLALNSEDASMILRGQFSGEQFSKLKFLYLVNFDDDHVSFPYWFLQNITTLDGLLVERSSFKEIFQEEMPIDHRGKFKTGTRLEVLTLSNLHELQHICKEGFQIDPVLEVLETLHVDQCSKLKHLVPSSVTFSRLTYLEVENCNGLIHLITSSTASSLVRLSTLKITNCDSLEQIVAEEEREGSQDEIAFCSLQILELERLPMIKRFCSSNCVLNLPLLVNVVVKQCPRMRIFSERDTSTPMLQKILLDEEDGKVYWEGDLNRTIKKVFADMAIREEGSYADSSSDITESSQTHEMTANTTGTSSSEEQVGQSKSNQITETGKQETHKLPSQSHDKEQNEKASSGIETPLAQVAQNASSPSTNQDTGLAEGTREIGENIERPLVEATKIALSPTEIYDAVTGTHETIDQMPLVQPPQKHIESYHNMEEMNEIVEKPLIQTAQEAQRPAVIQDIGAGTQEIHDTMEKPLIQTDRDAEKLTTAQSTGSYPVLYFCLSWLYSLDELAHDRGVYKNLPEEPCDSYIGTQKVCDTIKKPSVPTAQDMSNSTMIPEAAIDPSPSQASEPMISPVQKSNIYTNYMKMIDILEQNMPYLEAGVKRHPQVLDWLNTERQRVFASSSFSLFAEVTRILRTTRRGHLTEDDRNHIKKCCSILEVVGFDASWLSYVYKCIEECGDGEDIKRRVEETKGQAFSLEAQLESIKNELASVKESLAFLLDKAGKLDDFIES